MIRFMERSDIDRGSDLWEAHYKAVSHRPFDVESTTQFLRVLLDTPGTVLLVHESKGLLNGIIGFAESPDPYSSNVLRANELFWYSPNPTTMMRLWDAAMHILKSDRVTEINIGIPSNPTLTRWLERRGFTLSRLFYSKEV